MLWQGHTELILFHWNIIDITLHYQFQVYNTILYSYIFQNNHHNVWFTSLTTYSYKFIFLVMRTLKIYSLNHFQMYWTARVTLVRTLYITSSGLHRFVTGSFYLDLLHPFCPLPNLLHWATANVGCIYVSSVFVCFVSIPQLSNVIQYLSVFDLLASRSFQVVTDIRNLFFMAE